MIVDVNADVIRLIADGHLLIRAYHARSGKWKPAFRVDLRGIDKSALAAAMQRADGVPMLALLESARCVEDSASSRGSS